MFEKAADAFGKQYRSESYWFVRRAVTEHPEDRSTAVVAKRNTIWASINMNVVHVFHDDIQFLDWAKDHPDAYVINFRANRSADYVVLHRADCRTIAVSSPAAGPLTTGAYRKVGGRDLRVFDDWIPHNITNGICVSDECVICKPRG